MKRAANGLIELLEPHDRVGRHFKFREFCKRDPVPPEHYDRLLRLCGLLDRLREVAEHPLLITSGYRSPGRNAETKGAAAMSQHQWMRAVDLHPVNAVPVDIANTLVRDMRGWLLRHADETGLGGLGYYPAMDLDPHTKKPRPRARIHVDQRPRLPGMSVTTWTA